MKFFKKIKIAALSCIAVLLCVTCTGSSGNILDVEAATKETTVSLKILATADLHGQATSYNYETGERYEAVGLSKLATLITTSKKELGTANTLLLDGGDFFYDYSTNYIYDNHPDVIQPILQIMDALEYDCITLGNHEFDYPWEYLEGQLKASNLYNKTIVSNFYYEDTSESVFAPSMIITKNAVGSDGNTYPVRIAVIGATRNGLSTRRYYYGGFYTEDIYTAVTAEAKRIKEAGEADVIIALVHGGTGILSGANTNVHPGTRLAKSSYIDAVITSHSHEEFPSSDGTYSSSLVVSEEKGLVYNKPLIATGSHAQALGVIDLTLTVNSNGSYSISSGTGYLKHVTPELEETKLCNRIFNQYMLEMSAARDKTRYPIAEGMVYTNLGCFIRDNALYQLYNNAKLEYAYSYVAENVPEYADTPIIVATANFLDSSESYVAITDHFDEAAVSKIIAESSLMRDSGYIHIYKITGAKLREWLEYNASFYATAKTTTESILPSLFASKPHAYQFVRDPFLDNYGSFFIFDGINYEINITQKPRYNMYGNMLASSRHRITTVKYNGKEITDDQEFLIVMDSLNTHFSFMPTDEDTIFTTAPWDTGKQIFLNYLEEISQLGPINIQADDNWHVKVPYKGYRFVVGMPMYTRDYISGNDWFVSYAANDTKQYKNYPIFYLAKYNSTLDMQRKLSMTLSVNKKNPTAGSVTITAHINKTYGAGIEKIEYLNGAYNADSPEWNNAIKCSSKITVNKNGTYSVKVTDTVGNSYVSCVTVNNIDTSIADAPKFSTFTNRITELKGTAVPGYTVVVNDAYNNTYTAVAGSDGTFIITLPYQPAFAVLNAYTVYNNKRSSNVSILVKKTGPNQPYVEGIISGDYIMLGNADPNMVIYIRVGNTIFANKEDFELIKASEFYKSEYTLKKADISISEDGSFFVELPTTFKAGKTYHTYAVNARGITSRAYSLKCE